MTAKSDQPLSSELLAAYLEGEVTPHEATHIERALEDCSVNRRHLEELRRIRDALAAPAPEVDDLELVAAVRNKVQVQAQAPVLLHPRKRATRFGALAAAAAAAVAAVFLGGVLQRSSLNVPASDEEFRSKAVSSADANERWTGIRIYRLVPDQAPEPVTESLDPHDTLLFSYINLGSDPFEHLMIFAVGADQRIFWFYPAYESTADNPLSISIVPGQTLLAEAVEHDYSAGSLEVYALFSHQPARVSQVEAWLHGRAPPLDAAPIPGASLRRVSLRVGP